MGKTEFLEELKLLIRSRYGAIVVETPEEDRLEGLIRLLADQIRLPFFTWSRTQGLQRDGEKSGIYGTQAAVNALEHLTGAQFNAVYLFRGLGPDLENPEVEEKLKDVAKKFAHVPGIVIVNDEQVSLSGALKLLMTKMSLPSPTPEEFLELLLRLIRDLRRQTPIHVEISSDDEKRLLRNLKGLTLLEAEKILTKALIVDHALNAKDIERVIEAKKEVIERDGLLQYYPREAAMADIAGIQALKTWLRKRKRIIQTPDKAADYGLDFPKGILLVGIPGTGKSLCAKAVATEWQLPLLKMDPASLYNKYVGETESNFRRAMDVASQMAPVVLWIDEIEKALSTSEGDTGVSIRVLGTFLTWMQDRSGDVFIVATANDVSKLPPALLRKGRFDEIFFMDLPNEEARRAVFEIHLKKRNQNVDSFDLEALVRVTEGFTGADIEQVIISGMYTSFDQDTQLSTEVLLDEVGMTKPLTQTMPERVAALRKWAKGRTVPAN